MEHVKTFLMPGWNRDSILILDNCSPHKSKKSLECLAECGVKYKFRPPYSPDCNPAELLWNKTRTLLCGEKADTHDGLIEAVASA